MFGKAISVNTGNGKISGIAKKIDSDGALIIKTGTKNRRIFVGDVTLR
jgi:biotin-(acetyl-CoA carboxylase) ligase